MERGSLPCSALTFVRNGGRLFMNCLESAKFCQEHIVLDGGSTDETVALAQSYGCTVITQDVKYKNTKGQLIDYAGITNQGIAAATQDWVMILSADEELAPELKTAIEKTVHANVPGAFAFERVYVVEGRTIKYAATYPSRQIRVFHKSAIDGFRKRVHERPVLKPGMEVQVLPGIQRVPFDPPEVMAKKHDRYLMLELLQQGNKYTWYHWVKLLINKSVRIVYRLGVIAWLRMTKPKAECLPFAYEWLDIRYPLKLMWMSFPPVRNKLLMQE